MNDPKHIYISGPMRGHDGFNFPAFFAAERILREHYPLADICNPAREDVMRFDARHFLDDDPTGLTAGRWFVTEVEFGEPELRDALGRDMDFIARSCDNIVMLPGWEGSRGALAEKALAEAVGAPVSALDPETGLLSHLHPAEPVGRLTGPQTSDEEVRYTSATGGQKGTKLAAFDQISPEVEWLVAEHFGKGALKYDAHNFRKGYPWSKSYSALRRHLAAFWAGEEYDNHKPTCTEDCVDHTGSLHIVAVIWHAMVLTEFFLHRKEYDDRYVYAQASTDQ